MGIIARQSIKGAIANYVGVAIGFFVSFFVLTRFLTQEEVGLTRVMVDAAMLFSSLAQFGTNSSVVKFFPYFNDGRSCHGVFGWSLLLPAIGFTLVSLAVLFFRDPLLEVYSDNAPLLADYFYLLPMLTFYALYMTVFETNASVLMRITVPKLVREVGVRVFNLGAYLLYGFDWVSLDVFVWLFCGSYGVAMLLNFIYLLKISSFNLGIFKLDRSFLTRAKVVEILRYSLYMTVMVLAANIPLFNSLFLGAKAGLALTGVYTIASYVANVVEVPYRSLGAIARPVIAVAVKEDNWNEVNRLGKQVSLHQMLASLLIFYFIWINLDALFAVIPNGADYAGGVGVVLLLGLSKVVNSSLSIATDILNYSRYYFWGLPFVVLLTATAIFFNSTLIDSMGISGAACATLLAYLVYNVVLLLYLGRQLKVSVFSFGQLKMLIVFIVLMLLDYSWKCWINPVMSFPIVAAAVVKTVVLGAVALGAVYGWRISTTVNLMVQGVIHLKKKM